MLFVERIAGHRLNHSATGTLRVVVCVSQSRWPSICLHTHTNANGYSHRGWAGTEQGVLVEVINTIGINQKKENWWLTVAVKGFTAWCLYKNTKKENLRDGELNPDLARDKRPF